MTRNPAPSRRRVLCALAAAAVSPFAQGPSKRPVRIVVPFTPAAGPDIVARLLAPRLQARWDQPFFVENKPGASGTIGTEAVVKAPPDGHTIMVGPASIVTAPHLYPKISYDVLKDLTAVTNIGSTSLALAVHKSAPVGTLREFIAWVKSQPGKLNYGPPGNGTHHPLCMELLKLQADILSRYNSDIRAIVARPDMREQLAGQGLVPNTGTPEQFAKLVKEDFEKWGRVIRDAKIKAD